MSTILDIEDLVLGLTWQGSDPVVDGVSLSIASGETLALVGESGSGKSMTALATMGLMPSAMHIRSGRIGFESEKFGSIDLAAAGSKQMENVRGAEIGMIFQEPMSAFSLVHKVGDQVGEPLVRHLGLNRDQAMARAAELLEKVGVRDPGRAVHRYPFEFSGGMLQRAMIARAIACHPRLIIADEPTTALDVTIQAQVLELLSSVQKDVGAGMLFITHDLAVAATVADRIAVLKGGKLVEMGAVGTTLRNPQHDYTRDLLSSVPRMNKDAPADAAEELRSDPVLEIDNLSVTYPGTSSLFGRKSPPVEVLSKVSVSVERGSIVGLVGESGSGKTTLARAALGLVSASGGGVAFHSAGSGTSRIEALDGRALRDFWSKAQMVFQNPYASLNPWMTIEETLVEPLVQHGVTDMRRAKQRAADILDRCGMPRTAMSRFPHAFSGGQRQRIAIARALATEPELVFCDEPLSALDVSTQARIIELLKELRSEMNLTIILISHDLAVTSEICDDVAIMQDGVIVERGPCHEIFARPQEAYTANLLSAVPRLGDDVYA